MRNGGILESELKMLITNGEPEVISDCVPKTIPEIESLMKEKSYLNN